MTAQPNRKRLYSVEARGVFSAYGADAFMFRLGFPELVILFGAALFLFRPRSLSTREISLAEVSADKTFLTLLAALLVLFVLAELWIAYL